MRHSSHELTGRSLPACAFRLSLSDLRGACRAWQGVPRRKRLSSLSPSRSCLTRKEELLLGMSFTISSIIKLLVCLDTRWRGQARHEEGNPYTQRLSDVAAQFIAHPIRVPFRSIQEVLHRIGRRLACLFGHLPAIFTFDRAESTPAGTPRPALVRASRTT